jgi:hypothetical protein
MVVRELYRLSLTEPIAQTVRGHDVEDFPRDTDAALYRGTNSIVVSRRRSVRKPRTYLTDPGVGYLIA